MAFKYVAYDNGGRRVAGTLDAKSRQQAQNTLWASGLVVLSLRKQLRLPSLAKLVPTLFRVKRQDLINFSRELSSLLGSGIALRPALGVVHGVTQKRALKEGIRLVMRDIEVGLSYSEACRKQPSVFPSFYTRLLQVAEETGELRTILLRMVEHMEKQEALAGKIRKALTYPMIVLTVGLIGAVILVTVAVPALMELMAEYETEMPWTTRLLVDAGSFSQSHGKDVIMAAIALTVVGWLYIRTQRGKKEWDRLLLKVPLIGKMIRQNQMAQLCSNFSTLLNAGLSTTEALKLSIGATGNTVFGDALSEVYRQVSAGSSLERAISSQKIFPPLFHQTVGIAEQAGALKTNLAGLSGFYEQEADRLTTKLSALIEPALIIVVGLVIGFVGSAIISAIYSIIPQVE